MQSVTLDMFSGRQSVKQLRPILWDSMTKFQPFDVYFLNVSITTSKISFIYISLILTEHQYKSEFKKLHFSLLSF